MDFALKCPKPGDRARVADRVGLCQNPAGGMAMLFRSWSFVDVFGS